MQSDFIGPDMVNINRLTERTLSYLRALNKEGALLLSDKIASLIPEVIANSRFKACYEYYDIREITESEEMILAIGENEETLKSHDLCKLTQHCDKVCVLASTLGIQVDRYTKRVMLTEPSRGVVLDALFSAYLEEMTDEYENQIIKEPHTFRFAPGYGDLDILVNRMFHSYMKVEKNIGVTVTDGGLFLPQKSMLGIIGIGDTGSIDDTEDIDKCRGCIKMDDCQYRKEDQRCWM